MTLSEYHRLAHEFRQKIVPVVRSMLVFGTTVMTKSAEKTIREALNISEAAPFPKELFMWEPISIEIQDTLNEDQLLVLITLTIPKMVDGKLSENRKDSAEYKCIARLLPNSLLIISASKFNHFKKSTIPGLILEKRSQTQKCTIKTESKMTSEVPTVDNILRASKAFVRSKFNKLQTLKAQEEQTTQETLTTQKVRAISVDTEDNNIKTTKAGNCELSATIE